jgi:hypothetical protein
MVTLVRVTALLILLSGAWSTPVEPSTQPRSMDPEPVRGIHISFCVLLTSRKCKNCEAIGAVDNAGSGATPMLVERQVGVWCEEVHQNIVCLRDPH